VYCQRYEQYLLQSGQVADDDGSLTKKDILGVQGGAASALSGGADRPQPRAVPTIAGIQGGGVTI
jgi:hypothetical protein